MLIRSISVNAGFRESLWVEFLWATRLKRWCNKNMVSMVEPEKSEKKLHLEGIQCDAEGYDIPKPRITEKCETKQIA